MILVNIVNAILKVIYFVKQPHIMYPIIVVLIAVIFATKDYAFVEDKEEE